MTEINGGIRGLLDPVLIKDTYSSLGNFPAFRLHFQVIRMLDKILIGVIPVLLLHKAIVGAAKPQPLVKPGNGRRAAPYTILQVQVKTNGTFSR